MEKRERIVYIGYDVIFWLSSSLCVRGATRGCRIPPTAVQNKETTTTRRRRLTCTDISQKRELPKRASRKHPSRSKRSSSVRRSHGDAEHKRCRQMLSHEKEIVAVTPFIGSISKQTAAAFVPYVPTQHFTKTFQSHRPTKTNQTGPLRSNPHR